MTLAASVDTPRRTAYTAMSLAISEILGKIASLVMFIVCARVLGLEEFGVYSFGLGIGLLLAVCPSMGLDARLVQLASADPRCLGACLGALLRIRALVVAGLLGPVLAVLAVTTTDANHFAAVAMLVVASLLDTFSDAFRAACGARQRQHRTAVVLVVQRVLGLVLVVILLMVYEQVWAAALGYLVSVLFGMAGMADAARRADAVPQLRGTHREVRRLLAAARVMGLEAVVTMGLFRIDTVLIGVLLGHAAVGAYSAAYRLLEAVLFVSWTISRAYVPVIASHGRDPAQVRRWARRCSLVVFALYVPYGVALLVRGDEILALLFGAEFVTPLMMASIAAAPLMFGVAHLSASVLLALRPDPVVLRASVVALVLNLALNLVLIPWWGIVGAGFATTAAFIVQALVLLPTLRAEIGVIFDSRRIGVVALASMVAGAAMTVPAPPLLSVVVGAVVYVIAWVATSRVVDRAAVTELRSLLPARVAMGPRS